MRKRSTQKQREERERKMGVEIVEELEQGPTFRFNVAVCQDDQCSMVEITFKQEHLRDGETTESFVQLVFEFLLEKQKKSADEIGESVDVEQLQTKFPDWRN
eukprot:TRINITY_DN2249_c0_g1_i1.p1 TRINITY_DN2249_c0_g1~~TRINITY_DN2249_c0_g1_i1.p1  ORF type:complete len:102 (+),score=36.91 TRINITY_DN2249_c0_g1_i1:32-337(+)